MERRRSSRMMYVVWWTLFHEDGAGKDETTNERGTAWVAVGPPLVGRKTVCWFGRNSMYRRRSVVVCVVFSCTMS